MTAEISEQNLALCLQNTLEPAARSRAEQELLQMEDKAQFSVHLLQMVKNTTFPDHIRFAASLLFKNFIKRQWPESAEISKLKEVDRETLKKNIIPLMTFVPEKLQLQLSDAVSVMAQHDFPENWTNLISDLVGNFSATDYNVNAAMLRTAHSIFKRYRHEFRSDTLFIEIKFVLEHFTQPFMQLLINTDNLIQQNLQNVEALRVLFNCVWIQCKIFYSLNFQDIPEFFEDNQRVFMSIFLKYLSYNNAALASDTDDEAGILEKVKSSICEIADLYAKKYEDVFPDLSNFVQAVWECLTSVTLDQKNDRLVSTGITFLSSVCKHERHRAMFEAPAILQGICEKIILPNIELRESDLEMFEDDPIEYIRRDLEGSDSDTRRRSAVDFVRSLSEQFESQLTGIFGGYVAHFLQKYAASPTKNWKDKDTAIYLLIAITAKSATSSFGAVRTNQNISIPDMFSANIIADLQAPVDGAAVSPVLKVDAIKFLNIFRHQLSKEQLSSVFPLIVAHISSANYVVRTYAAVCIERVLFMKQADGTLMFTASDLKPYTQSLLTNLFQLIEAGQTPEKVSENDYLMKTVMRVIAISRQDMAPFVSFILGHFTNILSVISKNPSNPKFNHYLFESIGSLIRFICSVDAKLVVEFEKLLLNPIFAILGLDIPEFTPYALQILAQLLEFHPQDSGIPVIYQEKLQVFLLPAAWEMTGNIPALVRLLQGYLLKGADDIAKTGKVPAFLGIFQKLIASRLNDQYGFELLNSIFLHIPMHTLGQYVGQIFNIILLRMQSSKTVKYVNSLLKFICGVACSLKAVNGAQMVVQTLDQIQPKLFQIVMQNVLIPEIKTLGTSQERKLCAVALTRFVCSAGATQTADYVPLCALMLTEVIKIILSPISKDHSKIADEEEELYNADLDEAGYQAAFVKLHSLAKATSDPVPEVTDLSAYLKHQLAQIPAQMSGIMALLPVEDQKFLNTLLQ